VANIQECNGGGVGPGVTSVNGEGGAVTLAPGVVTSVAGRQGAVVITAADLADFNTAVRANRLDQMATPTGTVSMGSQSVTNVAAPFFATDAAAYKNTYTSLRAAKTADYTFVGGDAGYTVELASGSFAFTIPPQSSVTWNTGTIIRVANSGSGTLTISPGSGVTLGAPGSVFTLAQGYAGYLWQRSTDNWWLIPFGGGGSVAAASTTAAGIVELATTAETQTGTDTVRAVTPAGASGTYPTFDEAIFESQVFS